MHMIVLQCNSNTARVIQCSFETDSRPGRCVGVLVQVVPFFYFPKNSSHVNDTSYTFFIDANTTITESSPRGFIVDLLREMAKKTVNNNESFAFNVHVVKDNKYGSRINASLQL
jgi:hypothetical protein